MYIQLLSKVSENFKQYFDPETNKPLDYFGPINEINIFIGANNSGKSRFMRELIKQDGYYYSKSVDFFSILNECFIICDQILLETKSISYFQSYHKERFESIVKVLVDFRQNIFNSTNLQSQIHLLKGLLLNFKSNYNGPNSQSVQGKFEKMIEYFNELHNNRIVHLPVMHKVYIPVFRTIKALIFDKDIFEQRIREDYGLTNTEVLEVFTGLKLYDTLDLDKNVGVVSRNRVEDFENFLNECFFNDVNLTLTARRDRKGVITITLNNSIERELYNVGDGINAIIILMYKLFTANDSSWIFIEEPETNLHPAFQRIFLNTLITNPVLKKKKLRIFITTHSNHLMDLSVDIRDNVSVFIFDKSTFDGNEILFLNHVEHNDLRILNLLGVNNSSVFMSNCYIWVEGITDRKYLKAYLRAFFSSEDFKKNNSKIYLEDLDFAFWEYSGSNIEHYIFKEDIEMQDLTGKNEKINARYISNRIFLLADSDGPEKDKKHKERANQISENMHYEVTEGKEIENLISVELLKEVLPKFQNTFEKDTVESTEIIEDEYKNTGIGEYLDGKFKTKIASDSGTLSGYYKNKLADLICEGVTWSNMSERARELTLKIFEFIKKNNEH